MNSTNQIARIFYTGEYGEVHQLFSTDNPSTVMNEGHIGVCYINNHITYNIIQISLQATGMGYVSGFYTIQFADEGFKIEFVTKA